MADVVVSWLSTELCTLRLTSFTLILSHPFCCMTSSKLQVGHLHHSPTTPSQAIHAEPPQFYTTPLMDPAAAHHLLCCQRAFR